MSVEAVSNRSEALSVASVTRPPSDTKLIVDLAERVRQWVLEGKPRKR